MNVVYRPTVKLYVTLAISFIGFLLNGSVMLLDGVALLFGGVFYLLIARLFGPVYGAIAALLISSRTLGDWGHPYGLVIFTLEAAVAGWLCRRKFSLWAADALYWMCCGVPLLLIFFGFGAPHAASAPALVLKQSLNGLLDVALAELLLLTLPIDRFAVLKSVSPRPFRALLFSAFILVATLPLFLLNIAATRYETDQRQSEAEQQLRQTALAIETLAHQHLQAQRNGILMLADSISSGGDFTAELLRRRLAHAHAIYTSFLTMIATGEDGQVLARHPQTAFSGKVIGAESVSDRDYFRQPLTTGLPFLSDTFRGRAFGVHPIIAISAPFLRKDGRVAGVVEGSLDLERFATMEDQQHVGAQQVLLIDRRNHVIHGSLAFGYAPLTDLTSTSLMRGLTKPTRIFRYRADGRAYLAYTSVTPEGWRIIVRIPVDIIQEVAQRDFLRTAAWALVAAGLCLGLAQLASVRVTGPLESVVAGFRKYVPGISYRPPDLAETAPVELVELTREFTRLTGRLDESYSDLEKARDTATAANGRLEAVLADLDSTVQERTAQLDEANRLLLALVNSSPAAIIVITPELTVRIWNPAAERLFGWAAAQTVNAPLPAAFGKDADNFRALCQRTAAGTVVEETGSRWASRSGKEVDVDIAMAALQNSTGDVTGILILAKDIADRKRAEQDRIKLAGQLEHAQRLESIGRLAGGVAHDFNNLLTVINGYSDLLLSRLTERDSIRQQVVQIKAAGGRAAALTQQLLAVSRKQIAKPQPLDANRLIEEVITLLKPLFGERTRLATNLDPGGAWIVADSGQLHQVLMNLALNAQDAMPGGGTLTISTRCTEVSEAEAGDDPDARPGSYVLLTVSDTGIGMDEHTRKRAMEPFFTAKPKGKGTGLGLAVVHGIVAQSGGWLSLRSAPGAGTTVGLYLPRATDRVQPETGTGTVQPAVYGSGTVLVAEDEPGVRDLAAQILKDCGFQVLTASCGDEALAVSRAYGEAIDLLLTDVFMPGMTGRELAGSLAELRPGIAVVYMSGYAEDVIAHRGRLEHGVALVPKPFSPSELTAKINAALRNRPHSL